jgi:hypothetical protein
MMSVQRPARGDHAAQASRVLARVVYRTIAVLMLAPWSLPATAEPLTIVNLSSPALRCVFATNKHCNLDGTASLAAIPIRGTAGKAVLHSLTFPADPDSPAAGSTGYEFRLDLTQATAWPTKVCVTQLTLDVGPLSRLPYTGRADQFDVFVINTGATGFVGLASADRAGPAITFVFAKPVCPGANPDKGESSYFFGFAAAAAPRARVTLDSGETLQTRARAPAP